MIFLKNTNEIMNKEKKYGANNYKPLPIVISKAEGVWVEDPEGNRYMDMLSAYSSVNQGHRHPKIIAALKEQADKVTITSRAFYNEKLGELYEKLSIMTKKEAILPMNTGAEAVETAIKMARKWANEVKKVSNNWANIIVARGNFHGRTTTITSFSTEEDYKKGFGPYTPGFIDVEYGNIKALESAINQNTAAVMLEPIQGEAGIIIPTSGYLKQVSELCKKYNVLLMVDEIQTGFGRTGKLFASDWDEVIPDVYILGKALGGGVIPVSAVAADKHIMDVFTPGTHGSTFGGNPLASAVAVAALKVVEEEKLAERSLELGDYLLNELKKINSPIIKEIRGKGLFIGIELTIPARVYCEKLKELGILCKETHENTIRLAPPLIITKEEINWAIEKIKQVL
jgi:ornithine--oxo-acid transaminase